MSIEGKTESEEAGVEGFPLVGKARVDANCQDLERWWDSVLRPDKI